MTLSNVGTTVTDSGFNKGWGLGGSVESPELKLRHYNMPTWPQNAGNPISKDSCRQSLACTPYFKNPVSAPGRVLKSQYVTMIIFIVAFVVTVLPNNWKILVSETNFNLFLLQDKTLFENYWWGGGGGNLNLFKLILA